LIGALVWQLHSQYLPLGDFAGFIIAIFTQQLGEMFLGIVFFGLTGALYVRYQNLSMVSILWILIGGLLHQAVPTTGINIGTIMFIFGIWGILYRLFIQGRGSSV